MTICAQEGVTYAYQGTNTGDSTLSNLAVVDGSGALANPSYDLLRRGGASLSAATVSAVVVGQDPLGNPVTDSDSIAVVVKPDGGSLGERGYNPFVTRNGSIL